MCVVARAFNTSTQEAETGISLNLKLGWSTEHISGQPEPHRKTLFSKENNKQKNRINLHVSGQKTIQ